MKLVSVPEMIAIEKEANADGLTYEIMMENAGRGLAEVILDEYSHFAVESALGLVGSGNNGGDTLVALDYLAGHGWKVSAYIVRPRPEGDPLVQRLVASGGTIIKMDDDPKLEELGNLLEEHSVFMDGVLGTGLSLPLKIRSGESVGGRTSEAGRNAHAATHRGRRLPFRRRL